MIKVQIELWMGKEFGKDFRVASELRSIREEELEDGVTVTNFMEDLAERYRPIREKIFDREAGRFYPHVVVNLNDRVISPHEVYDKVLKDGDRITVLPMYLGG